eukprot:scaffold91038_cov26-Tisochrysis_lutea.AAC.1
MEGEKSSSASKASNKRVGSSTPSELRLHIGGVEPVVPCATVVREDRSHLRLGRQRLGADPDCTPTKAVEHLLAHECEELLARAVAIAVLNAPLGRSELRKELGASLTTGASRTPCSDTHRIALPPSPAAAQAASRGTPNACSTVRHAASLASKALSSSTTTVLHNASARSDRRRPIDRFSHADSSGARGCALTPKVRRRSQVAASMDSRAALASAFIHGSISAVPEQPRSNANKPAGVSESHDGRAPASHNLASTRSRSGVQSTSMHAWIAFSAAPSSLPSTEASQRAGSALAERWAAAAAAGALVLNVLRAVWPPASSVGLSGAGLTARDELHPISLPSPFPSPLPFPLTPGQKGGGSAQGRGERSFGTG